MNVGSPDRQYLNRGIGKTADVKFKKIILMTFRANKSIVFIIKLEKYKMVEKLKKIHILTIIQPKQNVFIVTVKL